VVVAVVFTHFAVLAFDIIKQTTFNRWCATLRLHVSEAVKTVVPVQHADIIHKAVIHKSLPVGLVTLVVATSARVGAEFIYLSNPLLVNRQKILLLLSKRPKPALFA
jgi:hypothetical protein